MKCFFTRAAFIALNLTLLTTFISIPFWTIFSKTHIEEVNVFTWGSFLSPQTISKFEDKYNIKVNLQTCTSNEEMFTKVRYSDKGAFDIVFASDYAVKILREEEKIKPLDKSKLNFIPRLAPILLNHEFDPNNNYSMPYSWEVYGIAQSNDLTTVTENPSLSQIFESRNSHNKVAMIPDPVEAFSVAAYYLHNKIYGLTRKQIDETKALLTTQRSWVEAYVDFRAKYLVVTENCPVGLIKSSFLPELTDESNNISYKLPQEGTFASIEHVVIPTGAKHEEAAYLFLNHIFENSSFHETFKFCAMFPSCLDAIEGSLHDIPECKDLLREILKRENLLLYDYVIPSAELREAWIEIKN